MIEDELSGGGDVGVSRPSRDAMFDTHVWGSAELGQKGVPSQRTDTVTSGIAAVRAFADDDSNTTETPATATPSPLISPGFDHRVQCVNSPSRRFSPANWTPTAAR